MKRPAAALVVCAVLAMVTVLGASHGVRTAAAQNSARAAGRPLQHVVLVTQDHRSFDHYFGTRPGVDGIPAGVCLPSGTDKPCVAPYLLDSSTELTPFNDGRRYLLGQIDGGKMDGFVSTYANSAADGRQTMGHYDRTELPYYWQLADDFMVMDHYFAAQPTNGVANRYFAVTGSLPPGGATAVPATGWSTVPTIFDRLDEAKVDWRVYVQGWGNTTPAPAVLARLRSRIPVLGMAAYQDPAALAGHFVDLSQYYRDAAANRLPAVSWVVATGPTERPPASPASGMRFARTLVVGLQTSEAWPSSALLLDYDSSGGWYDHVPPPAAGDQARGARVPALLVSPLLKAGTVDSDVMDSAAGLRLVEQNWSLPSLTARDAGSPSLLSRLDLAQPRPPRLGPASAPLRTPASQTVGVYVLYTAVLLLAGGLGVRRRRAVVLPVQSVRPGLLTPKA